MRRNLLILAALAVAASPAAGQTDSSQQKKPQPGNVAPAQPVKPVEPVTQVDADPEHGVPPPGQSREWREKLKAREEAHKAREAEVDADKPDVLLDVPDVSVEEISFELDNLRAHLSLDAKVANLVQLNAGVDLGIDRVKLLIKGVHAEALLKVRLKHVADIVDRALTTIDRNPQIISQLLSTVEKTVTTVGDVAKTALAPGGLLSQTVNTLGQTVQHVVDTTGRIVERTLDTTGQLVTAKPVGDLKTLKLIAETKDASGNTIREVEDGAGNVIKYIVDPHGKVLDVHVNPKTVREAAN
jgi:hypothetical protein